MITPPVPWSYQGRGKRAQFLSNNFFQTGAHRKNTFGHGNFPTIYFPWLAPFQWKIMEQSSNSFLRKPNHTPLITWWKYSWFPWWSKWREEMFWVLLISFSQEYSHKEVELPLLCIWENMDSILRAWHIYTNFFSILIGKIPCENLNNQFELCTIQFFHALAIVLFCVQSTTFFFFFFCYTQNDTNILNEVEWGGTKKFNYQSWFTFCLLLIQIEQSIWFNQVR